MEAGDKTIAIRDAGTMKRLKLMRDGTYAEVVTLEMTMDPSEHVQEHADLAASGANLANHMQEHAGMGVNPGTSKLGAAIRAYQNGYRTRPPVIFMMGDSNMTGEGGGTSGARMMNGAFANSVPQKVADYLSSIKGIPVKKSATFGDGNSGIVGVALNDYDPRITVSGGWNRSANTGTIGGRYIETSDTTGQLVYSLGAGITDIEIYYPIVSAQGSTSVGVYNSADTQLGIINMATAAASIGVLKINSSTIADGVIKFKNLASGKAWIAGVLAYGPNQIIVAQGTWSGSKVSDYATLTSPYLGCGFLDLIQPDLTVVSEIINDINAGTTASAYNASLSTIASKAALYGDVVLMTSAPGGGANYTANQGWLNLEQEMQKVAGVYGCETLSMHKEFVSNAAIIAAGFSYDTVPHLTSVGYAKVANILAQKIRSMI